MAAMWRLRRTKGSEPGAAGAAARSDCAAAESWASVASPAPVIVVDSTYTARYQENVIYIYIIYRRRMGLGRVRCVWPKGEGGNRPTDRQEKWQRRGEKRGNFSHLSDKVAKLNFVSARFFSVEVA